MKQVLSAFLAIVIAVAVVTLTGCSFSYEQGKITVAPISDQQYRNLYCQREFGPGVSCPK
jgi:hypothetical protein